MKSSVQSLLFMAALSVFNFFFSKNCHSQDVSSKIETYLQKAAANGYHGSVLVAKQGQVLVDKGYGLADRESQRPETPETVFSTGSITKQFTAAAIMKLEAMGKLAVSDRLSKYFPEAPADKKDITLHQLLTHSAGFRGALGDDYDPVGAADFMKLAFQSELSFPPGDGYDYSNVGYSILGIILEQVSGQNYETFLREKLWLPAGMNHTGYQAPGFKKEQLATGYRNGERWGTALDHTWAEDGPGWHLRANGGVLSTTGDMFKWYKALSNNTVLPAEATKKMFTPFVREGEDAPSFYGYGWVVQDFENGQRGIWHNGGNGVYNAFMGFVPAEDIVIIISSNSNNKISDDIGLRIFSILNGEVSEYLSDDFIKKYVGDYRLSSGALISTTFDENNNLVTKYNSPDAILLLLTDGTEEAMTVKSYNERTENIIHQSLKGNYQPAADALGAPLEEAAGMEADFWKEMQSKFGPVQSAKALTTVARARFDAQLTFVRVDFEKASRYLTYVWRHKDNLTDVRVAEILDKDFELQGDSTFFAPNNEVEVKFDEGENGKPRMSITLNGKVTMVEKN